MPRELIRQDASIRVYRVTDANGKVIGEDAESIPTPEDTNRATLEDRAAQAIAAAQAHIDRGTFTALQRDAALLLCLRMCVALARLVLGRLEAS